MVAQAQRVPAYHAKVMTEYGLLAAGSLARARMEAVAEGTVTYGDFKRLALKGENLSLFGENPIPFGGNIVNINANNLSIGVLSGGDSNVQGNVNNEQVNHIGVASDQLSKLLSLLEKLPKSDSISDGQKLAAEVVKAPTKGGVAKVLEWMTQIKSGADLALAATDGFQHVFKHLENLVDLLPL